MKFLLLLILIFFISCEKKTTAEKEKIITDQEFKEVSSITAEKKTIFTEKEFKKFLIYTNEQKLRRNFPNFDNNAIEQILKLIPADVIITSASWEEEEFKIIKIIYVTKDNTSTDTKYLGLNNENKWEDCTHGISIVH